MIDVEPESYTPQKYGCEFYFNEWLQQENVLEQRYYDETSDIYKIHLTFENFGKMLKWKKEEDEKNRLEFEQHYRDVRKMCDNNVAADDKSNKAENSFRELLIHNDSDTLMIKLHELLGNKTSGVYVAKILEALESKNHLIKRSYSVPLVIETFKLQCTGVENFCHGSNRLIDVFNNMNY